MLTGNVTINLGRSPTTARTGINFRFTGNCRISACAIVVQSRWTHL